MVRRRRRGDLKIEMVLECVFLGKVTTAGGAGAAGRPICSFASVQCKSPCWLSLWTLVVGHGTSAILKTAVYKERHIQDKIQKIVYEKKSKKILCIRKF
jgi:hypothetical protein